MLSALFYLQFHSAKNRTVMRLKRLKQPKYLVGGIVGGLYFYFYFFRYLFGVPGSRPNLPGGLSAESQMLFESIGACLLLVLVLLGWIFPRERAALAFSEAEVAFLFPAPISRGGLIHFKLLRSQAAILFTTFILMLVSNRFGGKFWIHAVGWWLVLSTLNLHFLGSSFVRTMLLDRGITNWQRRLVILGLLAVVGLFVGLWAWRSLPPLEFLGGEGLPPLDRLADYAQQVLTSGPLVYLLFPFRLLVRPYFASDVGSFLLVLGPALLVLGAHYVWVIRSNVAFEEASVEASRRTAEALAAVRAGNWQTANKQRKARKPPFTLHP
ncbi:MAG TPA: putative ABC exporter domain-containing protein, partial [Clostridia bacterium]|nr:putative ABC exporter domain-containing protein [Clostridia bacterium]